MNWQNGWSVELCYPVQRTGPKSLVPVKREPTARAGAITTAN